MKSILLSIIYIFSLSLIGQSQNSFRILLKDGKKVEFMVEDISQASFSLVTPPSRLEIKTMDSPNIHAFNLEDIDSIVYILKPTGTSYYDADSNQYSSVIIGSQEWMKENLKTTHFADGSPIPHVTDSLIWKSLAESVGDKTAYCDYQNNPAIGAVYGKLYNYYTTVDPRGLCPAGWHVPTDADWKTLEFYAGVEDDELDLEGGAVSRGGTNSAGKQLKSYSGWVLQGGGTDKYGFTAMPGGLRDCCNNYPPNYGAAIFSEQRGRAWFWSSSEETEGSPTGFYAFARMLDAQEKVIYRLLKNKAYGYSVRCIKD